MAPQPFRITLSFPAELAEALDQERSRLAAETRTRISFNQIAMRVFSLGIEAGRTR